MHMHTGGQAAARLNRQLRLLRIIKLNRLLRILKLSKNLKYLEQCVSIRQYIDIHSSIHSST